MIFMYNLMSSNISVKLALHNNGLQKALWNARN